MTLSSGDHVFRQSCEVVFVLLATALLQLLVRCLQVNFKDIVDSMSVWASHWEMVWEGGVCNVRCACGYTCDLCDSIRSHALSNKASGQLPERVWFWLLVAFMTGAHSFLQSIIDAADSASLKAAVAAYTPFMTRSTAEHSLGGR